MSVTIRSVLVLLGLLAVGLGALQGAGDPGPGPSAPPPGEDGTPSDGGTARATIERAVDGDTLVVRVGGERVRVRVLGIDTPETVKPDTPSQPCGPEASAGARAWAADHPRVRLRSDPAAPDADRFGRLLRWIDPVDGSPDLSAVQVGDGLARVAAYGQDLSRLPALDRAESRARDAGRGLWGGPCAG
jgi:micrococcal nuclease